MFWNKEIECMDRASLRNLQDRRLREMVAYVYDNTSFYRRKMYEAGITPADIRGVGDLYKLPFTTKTDLRDNYPFGLCAVPMKRIVRIHGSSGTTGKPTVVIYTKKDLEMWTECLSRAFTSFGADSDDMFQISYGYGLFTGGLGMHYGAENIGASVIPVSSGNTSKQIQLMRDFGTSVLCCTPSYALFQADAIRESGIPREEFNLRLGAFGAEPWTEAMRADLEAKLGIKAYDIYGLSEMSGPGVGYECECQCGTHLNEDHFYPEIVDPKTLEPLPEGKVGELVFTHLTKEGMPLLRYRTKDLTALHYEKCDCGRTFVRMDRILGRSDDMLIIRGVNVFPTQIESVILEFVELEPHYLLTVERINHTDRMSLDVELKPESYSDAINAMVALRRRVSVRLQEILGLSVDVHLVEPRSIERSTGKAKHVIDKRNLK
ncbi:MAG: phenylacetate--CoA ligase [Bacteroidales bacterium]|nr:phenylacetate--CoA ligase [Candidatus Cacconaster scatequi]